MKNDDKDITEELVREVDFLILELMTNNNLSALKLSSILNARLMWANYLSGSQEEFKISLKKFSTMGIEERSLH